MKIKRGLFYILCSCIVWTILFTCCSQSDHIETQSIVKEATEVSSLLDSTLNCLTAINQEMALNNQDISDTRGNTWEAIQIGWADAKGAFIGFCQGGVFGAIIGALIYSFASFIILCFQQTTDADVDVTNYGVSRSKIEYVYSNLRYTAGIESQMIQLNSDVNLVIPEKFQHLNSIGIQHNSVLHLYSNDYQGHLYKYPLTEKEKEYIDSEGYKKYYDYFLDNANRELSKPLSEPNKIEIPNCTQEQVRILALFYEGTKNARNMQDVNRLITSYIKVIERDNPISDSEREGIYAAFVTFAYSTSFWDKKLMDYSIRDLMTE